MLWRWPGSRDEGRGEGERVFAGRSCVEVVFLRLGRSRVSEGAQARGREFVRLARRVCLAGGQRAGEMLGLAGFQSWLADFSGTRGFSPPSIQRIWKEPRAGSREGQERVIGGNQEGLGRVQCSAAYVVHTFETLTQ
jgi:hypothetical protein